MASHFFKHSNNFACYLFLYLVILQTCLTAIVLLAALYDTNVTYMHSYSLGSMRNSKALFRY